MSVLATKQQSQKIFEKLKTKPANRVRDNPLDPRTRPYQERNKEDD